MERHAIPENSPRNRVILERRLNGEKLQIIASDYDITRERVRQLCNLTMSKLTEDEKTAALEKIAAVQSRSRYSSYGKELKRRHLTTKRALQNLFSTCFDRDQAQEIIGVDLADRNAIEFCDYIFENFHIRLFYKYARCSLCDITKLASDDFSPKSVGVKGRNCCICRQCNTERHRDATYRNPSLSAKVKQRQKNQPNYQRLMVLRYYYKKQGRFEEMPPLPPKGTPDSEIVLPPRHDPGYGLRVWRERMGIRPNQQNLQEKAKKLVIQEARRRGLDA